MAPFISRFGQQMSHLSGVRAIMKDIIEVLKTGQSFINLSAGNPVILPEIEQLWRDCTTDLLASSEYGEVVCRYGSSQGYQPFIDAVLDDFNQRYGLQLTERNILVTPGSQSLYFLAANALAGYAQEGHLKTIVLPLSPDYTGYGGVSLVPEAVVSYKPLLDIDEAHHSFKYRPDFDQLKIDGSTGFVLFSRPCNPTGNVLTDEEVGRIAAMAAPYDVPVLVDSAYACPYPGLNFAEMTPIFEKNVVHCISLSKAGLPGERIGVALGDERVIQTLEAFLTNFCLHSSRYGQAIAARAIRSGALAELSETVTRPYYRAKFEVLAAALRNSMPGDLPWYLHRGEGAIFAWLWFQDCPFTDVDLYQALKQVGVIVVPGHPFFPGLRDDWSHKHQCVRISLTASDEDLAIAMAKLGQVVDQIGRRQPILA